MKPTLLTVGFILVGIASAVAAAISPPAEPLANPLDPNLRAAGLALASALAVGICVIGAGLAMGRIGAAALGAAAEKPELLMRSLLFMALAEGLGILGFAIAILIIQKIG